MSRSHAGGSTSMGGAAAGMAHPAPRIRLSIHRILELFSAARTAFGRYPKLFEAATDVIEPGGPPEDFRVYPPSCAIQVTAWPMLGSSATDSTLFLIRCLRATGFRISPWVSSMVAG
jgi:hypothetical protein